MQHENRSLSYKRVIDLILCLCAALLLLSGHTIAYETGEDLNVTNETKMTGNLTIENPVSPIIIDDPEIITDNPPDQGDTPPEEEMVVDEERVVIPIIPSTENARKQLLILTGDSEKRTALCEILSSSDENLSIDVSLISEEEINATSLSFNKTWFIASVGEETAVLMQSRLPEDETIISCDIPDGIVLGTPADEEISGYWESADDDDLHNLLSILQEQILLQDTNKTEIAFVFSRQAEITAIEAAQFDPEINASINISVYYGRSDLDLSFDLSGFDLILLSNLDAGVIEGIRDTVLAAQANGSVVISIGPLLQSYNLHTEDPSDPEVQTVETYLLYHSEKNFNNLARFLGITWCGLQMNLEPPESRPIYGIYHPDAPDIYPTLSDYLEWYTGAGIYDPSRGTVGVITGDYTYMARDGPMLDTLVRSYENAGVNVIVATYHYKDPVRINYFMQDGMVMIDAGVLISKGSRLDYSDPERGVLNLKTLNVPILNAVRLFYDVDEETWRNSPHGVGPEQQWQLLIAELDGIIEPIVFATKAIDPVTGADYYKPMNDQVAWLTERTLAWVDLGRTDNQNKKVIIPYYSAEGGKSTVGADIDYYLDAQASLANLLLAMRDRGYDLGSGPLPDAEELADLMASKGYNIGTWVPDELKKRVEMGDVILIPEDQYLTWFGELSADKQQHMIDIWGAPPGEIMVYDENGGRSLVIPIIRFGNVILAPDPMPGWNQNTDVTYHDGAIPPTHQCFAFYTYMDRVFEADAIFSIFSIIPMMPGKEAGLAADDWGAILSGSMPHVHVLPMDAEGIFDRRRANMVIVDFMTPVLVPSGLYGELADLKETITNYRTVVDLAVKEGYKNEILATVKALGLHYDIGWNIDAISTDDTQFNAFLLDMDSYLKELATVNMPYGSHILGEVPDGESLVALINGMLGTSYKSHVEAAGGDEDAAIALLNEVILNGNNPNDAQQRILQQTSADITADLVLAEDYHQRILDCTIEIPRILDALEAHYIPPGPNGDPIRNPDALPTGRNLCTFDDRIIPTKVAWNVGVALGDELIATHRAQHGDYPDKVAFLLWSIETSRHQGTMESEIFWMLGVRPIWTANNRVSDVELIPSSELCRPRVDVVVVTSGSYRDMYASKIELIDKAVRLAAAADDGAMPNYVKINTDRIYQSLIAEGYDPARAMELAASRVFSPPPGSYTPGIEHAIGGTDSWDDPNQIADLYISRMSYIYGQSIWGEQYADIFRANLADVDIGVFSRTSNLYGTLEHPMVAAYFGGLSLAIQSISGNTPDMYINNQRNPQDQKLETLSQFVSRDLRSRYLNPAWIEGMMGNGFDGARYMESFVENMWLWDVTITDLITSEMWESVYATYVLDQYDLGLSEYFTSANPYAYQAMTARMLDVVRMGYWDPDFSVLYALTTEFQQSVQMNGVTCCHHTCGNLALEAYMNGIMSGRIQPDSFRDSGSDPSPASLPPPETTDAPAVTGATDAANTTIESSGVGSDITTYPGDAISTDRQVVGQVMTEDTRDRSSPTPMISTPVLAILLSVLVLGAVGTGFFIKRR